LQSAREGSRIAYTHVVPDSGRFVPAHRRYWRVAEIEGGGELRSRPQIPVPNRDLTWAKQTLATLPGPHLALAPGAIWPTKRWPCDRFAAVAAQAHRKFGFSAVILGSPDEVALGRELTTTLSRLMPESRIRDLTGHTTLSQMTATLRICDAALTNDSGPMHVASAVGTPTLSIFTCTDPDRSGPAAPHVRFVSSELPCAGSYKRRCPYRGRRHMLCHEEVGVARVANDFSQLVEAFRKRDLAEPGREAA
jgi:ADP-heptose:LPS heptosyltransferase